jgi:hypothetical protein
VSAVDKLLELAGPSRTTLVEDPAGDLVLAARTAVTELRVLLASDDDEDDKGSDDHSSHGTYKALKKRGMDDAKAKSLCAKSDKKVKAAQLAEAAEVALSALAAPEHDWVEATAASADALRLSCAGAAYADPGYQGKQRYRIASETDARLSLAYSAVARPGYTPVQAERIQARARQAAVQHGIALSVDADKIVADELVALAKKPVGDGGVIMNHGPFNGTHSHSHFQSQVHDHEHQHFGDNHHDGGPAHRPGSKPGGKAGW